MCCIDDCYMPSGEERAETRAEMEKREKKENGRAQ